VSQIYKASKLTFYSVNYDRRLGLGQWFSTIFTDLTLLSNKVTRFTLNKVNGAHLLKYEINEFLQFRMIYKKFTLAAFYGSINVPPWKLKFTPMGKFTPG